MSTGTVTLHRILKAPQLKVYRAFTEGNALAAWLPPNGFYAVVDHVDAKEGGTYEMSFVNFSTGKEQSFGGKYVELKTGTLLNTPIISMTPRCLVK